MPRISQRTTETSYSLFVSHIQFPFQSLFVRISIDTYYLGTDWHFSQQFREHSCSLRFSFLYQHSLTPHSIGPFADWQQEMHATLVRFFPPSDIFRSSSILRGDLAESTQLPLRARVRGTTAVQYNSSPSQLPGKSILLLRQFWSRLRSSLSNSGFSPT